MILDIVNENYIQHREWKLFFSYTFCQTCTILIRRPPDRTELMELKSKDLQQYLNKHDISTHGLVGMNGICTFLIRDLIIFY